MKKIRFLSALLAFITVLSAVSGVFAVTVAAEEEETTAEQIQTENGEKAGEPAEGLTGDGVETETGEVEEEVDYLTKEYTSKEDLLSDMSHRVTVKGYSIFINEDTAIVGVKNEKSGQILTTNPFDVGASTAADTVKQTLLSQLIVNFTYNSNGTTASLNSYKDAIAKGQYVIKNIKNGVRVEYSIGTVQTRRIVPRQIRKDRYEELIYANLSAEPALRFKGYYQLMDPEREGLTSSDREEMYSKYPITEETAIYVLAENVTERELNLIESFIKIDCPDYTYEVMMEDYALIKYTATADKAPLFQMSLEYKINDNGFEVRLPANGIRYDEESYLLNYIDILPYLGATSTENNGYIFIPDGSGAIISNTSLGTSNVSISSLIYGTDYAYQTITAVANQKRVTLPVFGAVEDVENKTIISEESERQDSVFDEKLNIRVSGWKKIFRTEEVRLCTDGFAAFMTEGDTLSTLMFEHTGGMHKYNSIYLRVTPRAQDSYNLREAISASDDSLFSVVSERKYTGSYRINYVILTDEKNAKEKGIEKFYPSTYAGMAAAYRDYLIDNGIVEKRSADKIKSDIPLYIEALGAMDTKDTFLTFPITVKTPLTTFEDLKTINEDLSENGIKNVNYRLTGFANGGLTSTIPYHVKFVKTLGGNNGFVDFAKYAEETGIGVFPDFDFEYAKYVTAFDGFSYKKDAVKTIDNRYISKREYSNLYQAYVGQGQMLISPARYEYIFGNFKKEISKLSTSGVSVSTLGTDLNSDFNKKNPFNRENAKGYVTDLFEKIKETFGEVMTDGGNSYVIPYVDHVLNVTIDSSGYTYAAGTVPFFGMVFHGIINFAGTPTNTSGNFDYEILKIIENGANPYFIIAYRNTSKLKEDSKYQEYHSVSYDIWKEDMVKAYKTLNEVLAPLQDSFIVDHEFVNAMRLASAEEIAEDEVREKLAEETAEKEEQAILAEIERKVNFAARMAEKAARNGDDVEPFDADAYREELLDAYYNPETSESLADKEGFVYDESLITYAPSGEAIYPREDEVVEVKIYVDEKEETVKTKYTIDDNSVVKVTYSDGTVFYLNYNDFTVTAEGHTIEAFSFLKI